MRSKRLCMTTVAIVAALAGCDSGSHDHVGGAGGGTASIGVGGSGAGTGGAGTGVGGMATLAATLSPPAIDSIIDFTNPMRGFYHWRNSDQYFTEDPDGKLNSGGTYPSLDRFDRYYWGDIPYTTDPMSGDVTYDFSANVIHDLQTYTDPTKNGGVQGRRFGIRMRVMSDGTDGAEHMPSFVCQNTYTHTVGGTSYDVDIPEWDQSCFQKPLDELLKQLSTALAPYHQQVNFIDIGVYGQWGEWNPASFTPVDPNNTVSYKASSTSLNYIIDEHVRYLGWAQLLLLVIAPDSQVSYAMGLSPGSNVLSTGSTTPVTLARPIGLRSDAYDRPCFLGGKGVFDYAYTPSADCNETHTIAESTRPAALLDRWKTAPFIGERGNTKNSMGFYDYTTQPVYDLVNGYHVSGISNDYYESPKTAALDDLYKKAALGAGYRLAISSVIVAGTTSAPTITINWLNQGNSPPYDPWNVDVWLTADGTSVATATQALSNSSLLPNTAVSQTSTLTTTGNLQAGATYTVMLRIEDPTGYLPNMALPLASGDSKNGYLLGSFQP